MLLGARGKVGAMGGMDLMKAGTVLIGEDSVWFMLVQSVKHMTLARGIIKRCKSYLTMSFSIRWLLMKVMSATTRPKSYQGDFGWKGIILLDLVG